MKLNILTSFFKKIKTRVNPSTQNLTHVYLYALTSIALLALVFNAIKFGLYAEQSEAIQAVREIERQLLTSDRLHSRLLDLQLNPSQEERSKNAILLKEHARIFFGAHDTISELRFFKDFCENHDCSPQILNHLNQLKEDNLNVTSQWIEKSQSEVKEYKIFLEQANLFLDDSASDTNNDLILLDVSFLLCLLGFLLFQATFIFRPAVSRLDHALSVRSEFLSRISHEIRNPMNAVLGMAEVLRGTRLNMEQKQYLDSLFRAGQTLLEMLNNLIEVSAVEGKNIKLKVAPFQIVQMIDKTSQVVSSLAHHKGIEFFVKIDPLLQRSYQADVSRLEQVLINLLNNAVKFTPKGYVILEVELIAQIDQKSRIRFSVKDTGIGIESTKTQEIFNSFVQEDSSIKRQYGGSGLGLSIASEILSMMHSQLKVESVKGTGSTFYFEIDLAHDPTARGSESSENSLPELKNPVVVLTSQFSAEISSVLRGHCSEFFVCQSEKQMKEILRTLEKPVDVVVDDSVGIITMIAAAEVVNRNSQHNLSALLKTSFPKENIDLIRKAEYTHFMLKPFRPWMLHTIENPDRHVVDDTSIQSDSLGELRFQLKVLAVDDSEDNLFLIRELLTPLVSRIDFASNGQEAIDRVKDEPYDIIFMDIQMPVMDGYTAIRRIRQLDEKNIPVIAVTAHGGVIDEKKCIEAGFSARLVKPISKEQLKNILEQFYSSKVIEAEGNNIMVEKDNSHEIDPMIQKLLPTFFATRDTDLNFLKEALEKNDFEQIKALGHKVKGSSLSYGFEDLGEKARALETAALDKDLLNCQRLYKELLSELEIKKDRYLH